MSTLSVDVVRERTPDGASMVRVQVASERTLTTFHLSPDYARQVAGALVSAATELTVVGDAPANGAAP